MNIPLCVPKTEFDDFPSAEVLGAFVVAPRLVRIGFAEGDECVAAMRRIDGWMEAPNASKPGGLTEDGAGCEGRDLLWRVRRRPRRRRSIVFP